MKRFMIALGICAFLCTGAATADAAISWDGGPSGTSTDWQTAVNWNPDTEYPGQYRDTDDAEIDNSNNPSAYPVLAADETIATLTMSDGTSAANDAVELDTNGYQLTVSGAFTVDDVSTGDLESYIEIRNDTGSGSNPGVIDAGSIVITGGSYGVTLSVVPGEYSTTTVKTS
jgi:hypothetical protein